MTSFWTCQSQWTLHISVISSKCCPYFIREGKVTDKAISSEWISQRWGCWWEHRGLGWLSSEVFVSDSSDYWSHAPLYCASPPNSLISFLCFYSLTLVTLDHLFIMGQCKGFLHYYFQDFIIAPDPAFPSGSTWFFEMQRQNTMNRAFTSGANHKLIRKYLFSTSLWN